MKSYVIFDLDGTLLNTIDDLAAATNYAPKAMGYPQHGLWVYPNMVGNGVRKLIERALPDDQHSEKVVNDTLAHFKEYYGEHCCDATTPYPGIPELLEELTAGYQPCRDIKQIRGGRDQDCSPLFPRCQFRGNTWQHRRYPPQARPVDSVQSLVDVPHPQSRSIVCRRLGRRHGNRPQSLRRIVRSNVGFRAYRGTSAGVRRPYNIYTVTNHRPCREIRHITGYEQKIQRACHHDRPAVSKP